MARFDPFPGLRYDPGRFDAVAVTAPPYDVIRSEQRIALRARSPHNIVHVDLPVDPAEQGEPKDYSDAADLLARWRREGALVRDDPSFYVYRMTWSTPGGERSTIGVIGALELSDPAEGQLLAHERTTPKAHSDRLDLLWATRANLSPIWVLSPTGGLTSLLGGRGAPTTVVDDEDGVRHELWLAQEPEAIDAIRESVAAAPLVVADGHHRLSTSLAYRDERHGAGDGPGDHDAVLALVVELSEETVEVAPIHRLLHALPADQPPHELLDELFEVTPAPATGRLDAELSNRGALGLVTPQGRWLLVPRPERFEGVRELDSARAELAIAALGEPEVSYQHDEAIVSTAVRDGEADAALLLRPATVSDVAAIARGGERMPPKTTFFAPKPRTGLVLRSFDR